MNYVFSKKKPEIGDKGFIVGDRFIPIQKSGTKIPIKGLIYYDDLETLKDKALTGQTYNKVGSVQESEYNNQKCLYFNGSSYLITNESSGLSGKNPTSQSVWIYAPNSKNVSGGFMTGGKNKKMIAIGADYGKVFLSGYDEDVDFRTNVSYDNWKHIVALFDVNQWRIYINGTYFNTYNVTNVNIADAPIYIGSTFGEFNLIGYVKSARLYNRLLTEDEIGLLANEFDV